MYSEASKYLLLNLDASVDWLAPIRHGSNKARLHLTMRKFNKTRHAQPRRRFQLLSNVPRIHLTIIPSFHSLNYMKQLSLLELMHTNQKEESYTPCQGISG